MGICGNITEVKVLSTLILNNYHFFMKSNGWIIFGVLRKTYLKYKKPSAMGEQSLVN